MKLRAIWEGPGRPSAESKADDKKRSQCLLEATEAIHMEFKEGQYKSIWEVIIPSMRGTKMMKHSTSLYRYLAFLMLIQVLYLALLNLYSYCIFHVM
jgi:hypothetical protein